MSSKTCFLSSSSSSMGLWRQPGYIYKLKNKWLFKSKSSKKAESKQFSLFTFITCIKHLMLYWGGKISKVKEYEMLPWKVGHYFLNQYNIHVLS